MPIFFENDEENYFLTNENDEKNYFSTNKDSKVKELNTTALKTLIKNKDTGFIMFYAPWCGHCKKLRPTWEEFAKVIDMKFNDLTIGALNCDTYGDEAKKLTEINGYPTIKYLDNGKFNDYLGDRETIDFIDFLSKHLKICNC
jgi:thioredoxin domain-containing protein 5